MKTKRKVFIIATLAIMLVGILLFTACSGKSDQSTIADEINQLVSDANPRMAIPVFSNELTTTVNESVEFTGIEELDEYTKSEMLAQGMDFNPIEGYKSKFEKVTSTMGMEDVSNWGMYENILYPGLIMRLNDPTKVNSPLETFGLPTGNITISTNMYTATGTADNSVSREIKNATLSSTRQAINELVRANLVDGSMHRAQISSDVTQVSSSSDLMLAMGISQSTSLSTDLSAKLQSKGLFNKSNASIENSNSFSESGTMNIDSQTGRAVTYIAVTISQIYYTMDIDEVWSLSELLRPETTLQQVNAAMSKGGVPVVVKSVSYGRKAMALIETDMTYSEFMSCYNQSASLSTSTTVNVESEMALLALLKANGSCHVEVNADGTFSLTTQSSLSEQSRYMNATCFMYGGAIAGNQGAIGATTVDGILTAFNAPYDPLQLIGAPISFTLCHVDGSNTIASVGQYNEYWRKTLVPIPVQQIYFEDTHKFQMDGIRIGQECLLGATRFSSEGNPITYPITYNISGFNTNSPDKPKIVKEGRNIFVRDKNGENVVSIICREDSFGPYGSYDYDLKIYDNYNYLGDTFTIVATAGGKTTAPYEIKIQEGVGSGEERTYASTYDSVTALKNVFGENNNIISINKNNILIDLSTTTSVSALNEKTISIGKDVNIIRLKGKSNVNFTNLNIIVEDRETLLTIEFESFNYTGKAPGAALTAGGKGDIVIKTFDSKSSINGNGTIGGDAIRVRGNLTIGTQGISVIDIIGGKGILGKYGGVASSGGNGGNGGSGISGAKDVSLTGYINVKGGNGGNGGDGGHYQGNGFSGGAGGAGGVAINASGTITKDATVTVVAGGKGASGGYAIAGSTSSFVCHICGGTSFTAWNPTASTTVRLCAKTSCPASHP